MSTQVIVNGHVLSAEASSTADTTSTNFIYVRGKGSLTTDQKVTLLNRKAKITEYLGNNTYLCRYEPQNLQPIRELNFVAQANIFPHNLKKAPTIVNALQTSQEKGRPEENFDIEVFLHKGEDASDEVITKLKKLAGKQQNDMSAHKNVIRLSANASTIEKIVDIDVVKTIEKVAQPELFNDISREDIGILYPRISPLDDPYEGDGQIVAVADTGFDLGSSTNPHPAFEGRVTALLGTGQRNKTDDPNGHGTHVAGSVLGDGLSETMGGRIQGAAPKASLVLQSILSDDDVHLKIPEYLSTLFGKPRELGARVACNSWGARWESLQIPYDTGAWEVDEFVWQNQDHVIVFAAGNDGDKGPPRTGQIGSTSAAKNCICVGATESRRPSTALCYDPEEGHIGDPNKIAYNSSRGPTFHGIIKPDIVAPGVAILSTCSRHADMGKNGRRERFGRTRDDMYMFCSGTSMATPLVTGCCAVLREALQKGGLKEPSAALIKALLVNGADNLGLDRADQGFGRANLKQSLLSVVIPTSGGRRYGFEDVGYKAGNALKEGEIWEPEHKIEFRKDETGYLKVTLAYSDPPGENLQNNLVLEVKIERSVDQSVAVIRDEKISTENNVAKVCYEITGDDNAAKITVTAARIAQLGESQTFALAWGIY